MVLQGFCWRRFLSGSLQLAEATQELDSSSAAVQDVGALQHDIDELKDKVRRLKEEHERIKAEVGQGGICFGKV